MGVGEISGKRRQLLLGGAALLAALPAALAQAPAAKTYRIGFLGVGSASGYVRELDWIRGGLRELGYEEGRNLAVEYRWAEGSEARLRAFAAEIVALKVDAIITHATAGAKAAAAATPTIPIVMADGGDPVAAGLAASLARPERNVTGSTSFVLDEVGKRLQLVKEVVPRLRRVAFLSSPGDVFIGSKRKALESAAASLNLEVREFVVRAPADIPGAFDAMAKAQVDAVVVNNEPFLNSHAGTIAALATAKRLPSVGYASYADAGGLIAYGANRPALYGRVGYFLDRIFRGARPGEIPFEQAAKFDLIVNDKTAQALGIAIPGTLRMQVTREPRN
jgi:putative ABC transport system substrate-binding protein